MICYTIPETSSGLTRVPLEVSGRKPPPPEQTPWTI